MRSLSGSRQQVPRQPGAVTAELHLLKKCSVVTAPPKVAVARLSCYLRSSCLRSGSYCVLHATSFISSFVPLHYTTFASKPFATRQGIPGHTQSNTLGYAPAFQQTIPTILTGFHSASLRHSFTSVAFSPPAANFSYARRPPHLGCVHLAAVRLIPSVHFACSC